MEKTLITNKAGDVVRAEYSYRGYTATLLPEVPMTTFRSDDYDDMMALPIIMNEKQIKETIDIRATFLELGFILKELREDK